MDGHAPANQLRLSLPGADRVKPERNLEAAKPPSAKCDPNLRPLVGSSHGTAVYGPVRTVVWEGRSREAPPYPDFSRLRKQSPSVQSFSSTPLYLSLDFQLRKRDNTAVERIGASF